MIIRTILIFILMLSAAYSQPIDANNNLIIPVNPPIDASPMQSKSVLIFPKTLQEMLRDIAQTQADLTNALKSGLAENHPTVKSLRAKLAVLQEQLVLSGTAKAEENEAAELKKEIEELKESAKKDQLLLLKQMADMKTEIELLRKELSESKKDEK